MKSKTGIAAVALTTFASIFVVISFCTPYWLVNDGQIEDPKFIRIGKFLTNFPVKEWPMFWTLMTNTNNRI